MNQNTPSYVSQKRASHQIKEKTSRKTRVCNIWEWQADFNAESEAKEFIMARGQFGLFYGGANTKNKVFLARKLNHEQMSNAMKNIVFYFHLKMHV